MQTLFSTNDVHPATDSTIGATSCAETSSAMIPSPDTG
jgi:hypothetical protein